MPSPFLQFSMKIPPDTRSSFQNGVMKQTNMEPVQLVPFYVTANNNGHLTSPVSEDSQQQIAPQKLSTMRQNQQIQHQINQQTIRHQIYPETPKNQLQNYTQIFQDQQIRRSIQDTDSNTVVNNSEVIVIEDEDAQEEGWINNRMKEAGVMDSTNILLALLGKKNFNTILSCICRTRNMREREEVLRALFSNQRSYKATGVQTQDVQIANGEMTQREDQWYITPNAEGLMPIHRSIVEGTGDLVADALALIRTGKHIEQRTTCPDQLTPLQLCILRDCGTDTLLQLLRLGCAVGSTDAAGRNALHHAVLAAPPETAALLARHAVNLGQDLFAALTVFDIDGYTPIMRSVLLQKPDHLKIWLETIAHENAKKFAVNLANPINGRTAFSLLENGNSAELRMCRKLLNSYSATQKAGAPNIVAAPSPITALPVTTNPAPAKPSKQEYKPDPLKVRTPSPSKQVSKSTSLPVDLPNSSKQASDPSQSQTSTHSSLKTASKPAQSQGKTPPSAKSRKREASREVNKIITGDGELTLPMRNTVKTPPARLNDIIKKRCTELLGNKAASDTPIGAQSPENLFVLKGDGKKKKSDVIRPVNMTVIVPETLKDITLLKNQCTKDSNWVNCIVTKVGTNFSEGNNLDSKVENSLIEVITSPDRVSDLTDGLDYITDDHDAPSYIGSLVEIPYLEENTVSSSPIIQPTSKRDLMKYEYFKNRGIKRKNKSKAKLRKSTGISKKVRQKVNSIDEDLILQLSISSVEENMDKEMIPDSPVKWKDQIMRKHTMQMNLEEHILNNPAMQPHVLLRRVRLAKGLMSVKLDKEGLIQKSK